MGYHIDKQLNLFNWLLKGAINPEHGLVKLAHKIDYNENLPDTSTIRDACSDWESACNRPALELTADREFHMRREDYP